MMHYKQEERLREIVKIGKQQYGFVRRSWTVDAIFIVKQLQEKRLERNQNPYYAFVYLEKAYDRIPREIMFWCLRKKSPGEVVYFGIDDVKRKKDKGNNSCCGNRNFEVIVRLHQGSALNPI
ncbi:uncharacterized protein [Palaemon carinicauda]|uniref:uncharacterized protein n=1 Tax=Palaemon carinicauda TaxID=392227 RepID=UPI0035B5ED94